MAEASAPHIADSHEMIRVVGARENNLKDISVDIPKRRLTVFTGVSGSGKSSLVFATIANESQRLINETYPTFVQQFMGQLNRPEVDALENVSPAIIVDQERMGANSRSTVGTATDAHAMLRILFSRIGQPHVGSPQAFSFNIPSVSGAGAVTFQKGGKTVKERRSFEITGGMCPRCEGLGEASDVDLDELFDRSKSLADGALTIPGYNVDGWMVKGFTESGFVDPAQADQDYTEQEMQDFLYKEPTKVKIQSINMTYEGLIPKLTKSMLQKDRDSLQPHIRAFVDRAVKFTACPDCGGSRLNEGARSSKIQGVNIADAAAMQISDLAEWLATIDDPEVGPLMKSLRATIDSFVDIGLGYLSLDRSSGTLSGGEAQRTKMIRHLGSALTDISYVFDEPTAGLHPHDIERMNTLLKLLRDKGNTVLVVEHKPEVIEIADHIVDLGPGAGRAGGEIQYTGDVAGLRTSGTITGRHLDDRARLKGSIRAPQGRPRDPRSDAAQPEERRRRHSARHPHRRDGGRGLGQVLAHPRQRPRLRRRGRRRPGADQGVAAQQSGDLHGHPRCHPLRLREGERRQARAVQRQLRGGVPRLQGPGRHHHDARLHADRRDAVRAVRRHRLQRRGAGVPARRQEHRRGARDVGGRGIRVLHEGARAHDARCA